LRTVSRGGAENAERGGALSAPSASPRETRDRRSTILLLVVLALACAPAERPLARANDKVRLNLIPSMTYAPFVIARDEGFFAAEGIDVEFVNLDSSSALLALQNGQLDVFSGAMRMGMFNMMRKGMPLRIVADKGHSAPLPCVSEALVAPVAMADRIAAAGGRVDGQRVAVARGGLTDYLIDALLTQRKAKGVVYVDLPQGSIASMRQDIDAIRHLTDPHLTTALGEGRVKVIAKGEDLVPGHQIAVMLYGKRLLHDDRDAGKRFMRAYLRGVRQYGEGKTDRNVAILSAHTKLDAEVVRRSCWLAIAADGQIRAEAVERMLEWSLRRGYVDGPVQRDQWWDPSFL
jgi:NitT/TauT family transport system substrate-binding protein